MIPEAMQEAVRAWGRCVETIRHTFAEAAESDGVIVYSAASRSLAAYLVEADRELQQGVQDGSLSPEEVRRRVEEIGGYAMQLLEWTGPESEASLAAFMARVEGPPA
jgi:hypothetical protein